MGEGKYEFREYLKHSLNFNNVLDINNEDILQAIHLNYRLLFFKDSVAARWLDETTGIVIETIVNNNYQAIVDCIFEDVEAPAKILGSMKAEAPIEVKLQAVKFVLEICNASKHIISDAKSEFFVSFLQKGFLTHLYEFYNLPHSANNSSSGGGAVATTAAQGEDVADKAEQLQVCASEILVKMLQAIPLKFKKSLVNESSDFVSSLLEIMIVSAFDGPKFEIAEFYKCLLNPDSEYLKTETLDLFYEESAPTLVAKLKSEPMSSLSLYLVLNLLTYCVNTHKYRAKYFVIQCSVLNCIAPLYGHRVKYVKLGALKLLKEIVELNDTGICSSIVANDALRPVIEAVRERENLINSVVLAIFAFVSQAKVTILTSYLVEKFPDFLKSGAFSHYMVIKELRINYELHKNYKTEEDAQMEPETRLK